MKSPRQQRAGHKGMPRKWWEYDRQSRSASASNHWPYTQRTWAGPAQSPSVSIRVEPGWAGVAAAHASQPRAPGQALERLGAFYKP